MAYESRTASAAVRYAQGQVRAALWEHGMHHEDLAREMGITQATVSNWLSGKRLDYGVLLDIAAALDRPIDRFLPPTADRQDRQIRSRCFVAGSAPSVADRVLSA